MLKSTPVSFNCRVGLVDRDVGRGTDVGHRDPLRVRSVGTHDADDLRHREPEDRDPSEDGGDPIVHVA